MWRRGRVHLAGSVLLGGMLVATAAAAAPPAGQWRGAIVHHPGQNEIDFTLALQQDQGGQWSGSLTVPLIRLLQAPLAAIAVTGDQVKFAYSDGDAARTFEGTLSPDGRRITGLYRRGEQSAPFELESCPAECHRAPLPGELLLLSSGAAELRERFTRDLDRLRLLIILSPT